MNQGDSKQFLYEVMENYRGTDKVNTLFKRVVQLYQVRPYKITKISPNQMYTSYSKLLARYEDNQLNELPNQWHKNERKLFIWFLICFCDLHQIKPSQIKDDVWERIGKLFYKKTKEFARFQGLNIMKEVRKYYWKGEDDILLKNLVKEYGTNTWNQISKIIFFRENGKFITPKQCRQRWFNHVNDELNKGEWSLKEDYKIVKYAVTNGKKWSKIIKVLKNKRTQHMIKNRYHSIYHKQKQEHKTENQVMLEVLKQYEQKFKEINKPIPDITHEDDSQNSEEEIDDMEEEQEEINNKQKKMTANANEVAKAKEQRYIEFSQSCKGKPQSIDPFAPLITNSQFMPLFTFSSTLYEDSSKLIESGQFVRQGVQSLINKSQDLFSQDERKKKDQLFLSSTQFGNRSMDILQQLKHGQSIPSLKNSIEYLRVPPSQISQEYRKLMNGETEKQAKN